MKTDTQTTTPVPVTEIQEQIASLDASISRLAEETSQLIERIRPITKQFPVYVDAEPQEPKLPGAHSEMGNCLYLFSSMVDRIYAQVTVAKANLAL